MRKLSPEYERQLQLRQDAESRLKEGSAPTNGGWTVGPDSLTLLYRLASDPDTAADALRLLSELQTHQVELDLQNSQLRTDQEELEQAMARYRGLYEFAPVGYLVVGLDGRILEGNRAGAELLGTEPNGLEGEPLASWFAQGSQSAVKGVVEACREGAAGVCCSVESSGLGSGGAEPLQMTASLGPSGEEVLLIVSRCEPSPR
ncbi:PAS domain S-box protein [Thioalkalivibrio sp. ALMg11]|uniref:PAS domain S-box protein n=1 Tax=Thioalkalivibrio sp. ALMg11 TaxID=1158165 RepID=UPI00036F541C|nr:PAS domain S-box protein [Thioalkalivibrio sp. ALMg11]